MKYSKGSIGRIFLVKFDNGDVLTDELDRFARREGVRAATILFIGALNSGSLVTGPKRPVVPPEPNWVEFGGGWEVMGMGTIFANRSGPQIHIHASMGKKARTLTGCVRKKSKVFLVIEAVVFELKGVKAAKDIDPDTGLNLLKIIGR